MARMVFLELFYSTWFIGAIYVIFVALSDLFFGDYSSYFRPKKGRVKAFIFRLILAPVWPLAALSSKGRKRLFVTMKGTNP